MNQLLYIICDDTTNIIQLKHTALNFGGIYHGEFYKTLDDGTINLCVIYGFDTITENTIKALKVRNPLHLDVYNFDIELGFSREELK